MKNKITGFKSLFTALVLAFGTLFSIASCGGIVAISGIHMSSEEVISVPYGNFNYDDVKVTVDYANGDHSEIPLEEEMIPEYERLKFYKMGDQQVKVVYRNRFTTTMNINVVLNQFNDVYALEGYTCVYDGLPHSVKLNHELPEGATIVYPYGNVFSNAGTYEITGVISKKGYESKTLTTTLTISQAERDVSEVVFEDATLVYNGEMRSIEATNIPEGLSVTYEYRNYETGTKVNKIVNVGKYRVIAHFNDENTNYKKIPDKTAILEITKADYDMSNIQFKNAVKEYDGEEYVPQLINAGYLPSNVNVNFKFLNEEGVEVQSNASAGIYTMVAEFSGGDVINYNPIEPMTAKLTVAKRVIKISNLITFESETVDFDENATHSILIKGTLPNNVTVTYLNNEQKYVGEYLITAKFAAKNANEAVDVEEMTAYLVINRIRKSIKMYNEATGEYDLDFSDSNIKVNKPNVTIETFDTTVYRVLSIKFFKPENSEIVEVNDLENGVRYEYLINFEYIDENLANSIILSVESGLYTYIGA